ncbi:hypothetical protein ACFWVB_02510 [Streptomyces microflavus]|uniref:hypothetical protein n=1 Tax=Streptomyces microflavus TaxID=1919 RepID=UPI0036694C03
MGAGKLRDTGDLLADMDALLAEVPDQSTAPAPAPEPEPTPEPTPAPQREPEGAGDEWEQITAPRPESPRGRTMRRDGWKPRELPETLQPKTDAPPAPAPGDAAAGPAVPPMPTAPPTVPAAPAAAARPVTITATKDDDLGDDREEDQDEREGDGQGEGEAPVPRVSRSKVIATTVSAYRLPPRLGGKGWGRLLAYTGSGVALGVTSGFIRGTYVTLHGLTFSTAAVCGITLSVALAVLTIHRSAKTFVALGIALAVVLTIQLLSLPVSAGCLATLVAWGLDQRARTMRLRIVAWLTRALFASVALTTFALTWTTVVRYITGATP